jgi:hypothetical protein
MIAMDTAEIVGRDASVGARWTSLAPVREVV